MSPAKAVASSDQIPFFSRSHVFGWMLVVLSIVGFAAAYLLVVDRLEMYKNPNAKLLCNVNAFISCGNVMEHWQAELLGIPNPILGLVCFAIVLTVGVSLIAGVRFPRWFWLLFQLAITAGLVLVVWFFTQAVYVISILCPNCMVVWACVIVMFTFTTAFSLNHGYLNSSPRLRTFLNSWAWPLIVVVYLLVFALIFLRFLPSIAAS